MAEATSQPHGFHEQANPDCRRGIASLLRFNVRIPAHFCGMQTGNSQCTRVKQ